MYTCGRTRMQYAYASSEKRSFQVTLILININRHLERSEEISKCYCVGTANLGEV